MSSTPSSTSPSSVASFDVDHHLGVLRRRWLSILFVLLVVVGATAYVTYEQTAMYRASVDFVVGSLIDPAGQSTSSSDEVLARLLGSGSQLETQTAAIESVPVAERAAILLDSDRSPQSLIGVVSARLTEQQVLVVEATSTDPTEAVDIANAFVDGYLGARNDEAITRLLQAQEQIQLRLDDAVQDLAALDTEITQLQPTQTIDPETGEPELPSATASVDPELAALFNERQQLASQIASFERQLSDIDTSETLASAGGQIINPATVPDEPFAPQPLRNIALSLVLGLTMGLGLAYLRDHLDDAIRSDHDIQRLVDKPILGRVPRWDHADRGRLITITEPASPIAEAYRTLRTNVRFLAAQPQLGSLLVTSPAVGEGKTTTAANLAVAYAKLGHRVLLVDADLRRPNIDDAFATARTPGLSEVLVGEAGPVEALQDVSIPNLRVLPAGTIPPNPSELLGSAAMIGLIREFEEIADLVIVDGPPLLAVSDSIGLATHTGMVVMVMEQGKTGRSAVRAAVQQLGNVGVEVSGVVLNSITEAEGGYAYAYYYREYTADIDDEKRKSRDRVKQNESFATDAFTAAGPGRRTRRQADKSGR